ncbi:unnamed protein product [Lepeophtheirus salmonis]|uniref:(salmon louse) hypothetical protein n=1 Tax=Lepeophtheirus salmonis TaxID=72036 RepID=A0A7R8H4J5_LEPSM|nr:unnamed protein product [Lepeophtheirus salmonis]CAF2860567.1 unnamed protein product [Lepeophtheirus salmonis]
MWGSPNENQKKDRTDSKKNNRVAPPILGADFLRHPNLSIDVTIGSLFKKRRLASTSTSSSLNKSSRSSFPLLCSSWDSHTPLALVPLGLFSSGLDRPDRVEGATDFFVANLATDIGLKHLLGHF